MEEMVNEAVDSALDSEDMEEEIEEEVDKVLASVAGETASQLPDAARTQKIHEASTSRVPEEVTTFPLNYDCMYVNMERCKGGMYAFQEATVVWEVDFGK